MAGKVSLHSLSPQSTTLHISLPPCSSCHQSPTLRFHVLVLPEANQSSTATKRKAIAVNDASGSSKSQSSTAWTPEEYPDPWTNPLACGGAATAPLGDGSGQKAPSDSNPNVNPVTDRDFLHWFYTPALSNDGQTAITPEEQAQFQQKRLLFCDPDRLLDTHTLKDVAFKLEAFTDMFASESLAGGGTFGSDSTQQDLAMESSEDGDKLPVEGNVTGYVFYDLINSIKSIWHRRDKGPTEAAAMLVQDHSRKLRGLSFLSNDVSPRNLGVWQDGSINEPIEVGIALVKKIDLPEILRSDSYFFYSDQDDMMNDAAQYFARYIHDTWYRHLMMEDQRISSPTNVVLIFISTEDKICYISSGTRIAAILPWWRLEHVVQDIKPDLRKGNIGAALGIAIDELTHLLQVGPPSFLDRVDDFVERFGVVIAFTMFTFVFATWGECRDRRKRLFSAERMSRMTAAEKKRARMLQREFRSKACPICLEPFDTTNKQLDEDESSSTQHIKRVDSFGIPIYGTDNKPIKLLRCGHIFDSTCWSIWVDSGKGGNPWVCPVCRQDVGRVKIRRSSQINNEQTDTIREEGTRVQERRASYARVPHITPSMLLLPVGNTHPSYSTMQSLSFASSLRSSQRDTPNAQVNDILTEETSLLQRAASTEETHDC
eukprot:scaffold23_cov29-Cyclotella_meneghiniana.AAC.2